MLEQIPPDELAGALLLTDGRHNRPSRVEDSARRFGILDAPLGIVAVGSPDPPRDAAVLAVRSPDAIHLGDRMRVSADLKFDGYKGKQAKVRLTRDGALIEEKGDHHPAGPAPRGGEVRASSRRGRHRRLSDRDRGA